MSEPKLKNLRCQICNKEKKYAELMPAEMVRPYVIETIKKSYPNWTEEGFICFADLNEFRTRHVQEIISTERGELSALEKKVITSMQAHHILTENLNAEFEKNLTIGEKLSDRLAEFGGSWKFLILFALSLVVWVFINAFWYNNTSFDPYPFILLNLFLSCLAAVQAPIIMMSQNRQESKDRLRAENEYRINLKAELEIRHLKAKIDQLISHQWRRLMEIQQLQTELIKELHGASAKSK